VSVTDEFRSKDMLQEFFGYPCVDGPSGYVPGLGGQDVQAFVYRRTRRRDLWPLDSNSPNWDEVAFLTAVEFMHDHVSLPTDGYVHDYMNCGYHASTFDREEGQRAYRAEVNELLKDYSTGFELDPTGEVVRAAPEFMGDLLANPVHPDTPDDVTAGVHDAVRKFRRRGSAASDRRDAVRDLAGVLELLTSRAPSALASGDEKDLFHLANKFGIRHSNDTQKTDYDPEIWFDWMFYYYLSTIQAFSRVVARPPAPTKRPTSPLLTRAQKRSPRFPDGSRIRHPRLGQGVVVTTVFHGAEEHVTVAFQGAGIKTLLADVSPLEALP
jgi:hypothetical protein